MPLPPPECKVYTPANLADAMVGSIDPRDNDFWLDPCIGPGAFVAQLRKRGISKEQIVGIDIDPEKGREDKAATTLRGIDFFEWCSSTKRKFTKIIANPPYVAISKLHPDLQKSLRDFGGIKDNAFALSSNYWCAFLSASMQVLENDGNLSFVLPAAWEYALYATEVRQAVLDRFHHVSVHRCLEPLFPPVREGRIVLVAKGYRKKPASAVRVDHVTSEQLVAALKRGNAKNAQPYKRPPKAADDDPRLHHRSRHIVVRDINLALHMASGPHFLFKLNDVNLGFYQNLAEAGNAEPAGISERLTWIRDVEAFFAFDDGAITPLAGAFLTGDHRLRNRRSTVDE